MVTGPYFLDLDPFRSPKSKLELVQFHSPYLKSNFVQFQIHSSSKILPKSSKFIPVAEILQAFYLIFHIKNWETLPKDPFSAGNTERAQIWILSIANTSLRGILFQTKEILGKKFTREKFVSLNWNWTDFSPEWTDPFQIRSSFLEKDLDPIKIQKKLECDPDRELLHQFLTMYAQRGGWTLLDFDRNWYAITYLPKVPHGICPIFQNKNLSPLRRLKVRLMRSDIFR